jgi:hypothetical protein
MSSSKKWRKFGFLYPLVFCAPQTWTQCPGQAGYIRKNAADLAISGASFSQ